jgi:hypothetical protein
LLDTNDRSRFVVLFFTGFIQLVVNLAAAQNQAFDRRVVDVIDFGDDLLKFTVAVIVQG